MTRLALIFALALLAEPAAVRQTIAGIVGSPRCDNGRNVTPCVHVRNSGIGSLEDWKYGLVFQVADQDGNGLWAFSEEPPNDQAAPAMKQGWRVIAQGPHTGRNRDTTTVSSAGCECMSDSRY